MNASLFIFIMTYFAFFIKNIGNFIFKFSFKIYQNALTKFNKVYGINLQCIHNILYVIKTKEWNTLFR